VRCTTLAAVVIGVGLWVRAGADTLPLDDFRSLRNGGVLTFASAKLYTEDRVLMHFYTGDLSGPVPKATLLIPTANWDYTYAPTPDYVGIVNLYTFSGDGIVSRDEWNAGTLFETVGGLTEPNLLLEFDVTSLLQGVVDSGGQYLSFNLRAGSRARFWFGYSVGLPNPSITISTIPVPSAATLLASALAAGLLGLRRKAGTE